MSDARSLAPTLGKTTCSHGHGDGHGMCIHMIRAIAIMEAKAARVKEKGPAKWT